MSAFDALLEVHPLIKRKYATSVNRWVILYNFEATIF
jgi:hypothetical protein